MAITDELQGRVSAGEVIVLDGATSTELQARGVPMDVVTWSAIANLQHPEVVQGIHEDYIRAGADVITANTYSTSPASLEPAGLGDRVEEINRRAVEIALRARDAAADRAVSTPSVQNDDIDPATAKDPPYVGAHGQLPRAGRDPGPGRG